MRIGDGKLLVMLISKGDPTTGWPIKSTCKCNLPFFEGRMRIGYEPDSKGSELKTAIPPMEPSLASTS